MSRKLFAILLLFIPFCLSAQNKKVAVVTFYIDKRIDLSEFGLETTADILKLGEDPNFNLEPMLQNFHTEFFNNYSKNFTFDLVPEAEVVNNDAYKAFVPEGRPAAAIDRMYISSAGYKVVQYNWGTQNTKDLIKIFPQYDGIMFVGIHFSLVKGMSIGGTGVVKVKANVVLGLQNKDDKKVFYIAESGTSKKTALAVGGLPVMSPEKILPMCQSAMDELMEGLQKRLPKLLKKTDEKL